MIELIVFYVFAAIAILSGIYVVASQNLVRSVFMFFVTLLSVAGLYVFALADFVALTQIVIYVGGVLVMLLFVFMLSSRDSLDNMANIKKEALSANRIPATLITLALLAIISYGILLVDFEQLDWIKSNQLLIDKAQTSNVHNIGMNIMGRFLLPFELISILLMMTLVGAAHLARKEPSND